MVPSRGIALKFCPQAVALEEPIMFVGNWLVGVAFAVGFVGGLLYFFAPDKFNDLTGVVMASIQ
jgi:hypothetical protein